MVSVRMFAALRDLAGASRTTVDAGTVGEVCTVLSGRYGERWAEVLSRSAVLVGGEAARPDQPVGDDTEVALLPPVSGGGV